MATRNGLATAAVFALMLLPEALSAAEPKSQPLTEAAVERLVAQLGHEDYALREAAARRLAKAGPVAIEPLAAALASENTEIAWRAASALEQVAAQADSRVLGQLLKAIEQSPAADQPALASLMADVRARHARFRRTQAIAQIRSLGGDDSPVAASDTVVQTTVVTLPAPFEPELEAVEVAAGAAQLEPKIVDAETLAAKAKAAIAEHASDPAPPPELAPPPEPAPPEGELELGEAVAEPAPPPDFLPVTPAGEVPLIEGEIGEPFVGDTVAIEVGGAGPVDPQTADVETPVHCLTLSAQWRGGDQGVALLKDLPELQQLNLEGADLTDASLESIAALPNLSFLKIRGTAITSAGLRKLRAQRPSLMITAAGDAMFGVSAQIAGDKCQLIAVTPRSAASQAGLQAGDFITQIDDAEVASFIDLMIAVFDRKPGDKLSVQFERGGQQKSALVQLQARETPPTLSR